MPVRTQPSKKAAHESSGSDWELLPDDDDKSAREQKQRPEAASETAHRRRQPRVAAVKAQSAGSSASWSKAVQRAAVI